MYKTQEGFFLEKEQGAMSLNLHFHLGYQRLNDNNGIFNNNYEWKLWQ